MPDIDVNGLSFRFPGSWRAHKYDEWAFYRLRFSRMWNGIKAVDVLAIDPDRTVWIIEVKDYRHHARTKPSGIAPEVASKVFDTLAALLPAKVNASDPTEKGFASVLLGARKLRVVLHLEQPRRHSRLRPRAINPADVTQALKRQLKPIDAHPFVAEMSRMGSLAWSVT